MALSTNVTEKSFASEVLQAETPVLVKFSASWCALCRAFAPIVKDLASQKEGLLKLVDVDESPDLATELDVRGVPTVIVFNEGRVVDRIHTVMTKEALLQRLEDKVPILASAK